jgi:NAD(P)-dependent dehydrogenase (short-subunit alcohol dehydrogenase family)
VKTDATKRVALVTGAGGIIGPGICRALQEAGWRVAATDVDDYGFQLLEALEERPFPAEFRLHARLDSQATCHELVGRVAAEFGSVGLLVNNAAWNPPAPDILALDEAVLDGMAMVNLWAPYFLLQACVPGFREAGGGAVVNLSSVQVERARPNQLVYPALKSALETMGGLLARELGRDNIRVNTVRVGPVPGHAFLVEKLRSLPLEKARDLYNTILPRHRAALGKMNPNNTATTPDDIGAAVAFLASDAARQVSGAVLTVDAAQSHLLSVDTAAANWGVEKAVEEWERKTE